MSERAVPGAITEDCPSKRETRPTMILASTGNGMNQQKVVGELSRKVLLRGHEPDYDSRRARS